MVRAALDIAPLFSFSVLADSDEVMKGFKATVGVAGIVLWRRAAICDGHACAKLSKGLKLRAVPSPSSHHFQGMVERNGRILNYASWIDG
jgi:hypothetical protein